MTYELFIPSTDVELESCFSAFATLRPHLKAADFLAQVRRQEAQSYQILALRHEGQIKSAAGFRIAEFLAWGKVLYIDDLTTLVDARRHGYAGAILDWLIGHAKHLQCAGVHLDTGYARHAAHRLYLRKDFQLNSHHLKRALK